MLYVNQPFGNWDFTNNVVLTLDTNDQIVTNAYQRTNATYALIYAFEPDWGWLQERQNQLDSYRQQGYPDTSRQVVSETLNVMGLNWMLQTEGIEQFLAAQLGILPQFHHRLGRMAQEGGNGYYVDVYMQTPGIFPMAALTPANTRQTCTLTCGAILQRAGEWSHRATAIHQSGGGLDREDAANWPTPTASPFFWPAAPIGRRASMYKTI